VVGNPPILSDLSAIIISCISTIHVHLLLLLRHCVSHANYLITHILLLIIECVTESPKLLRLRYFTLHLPLRVIRLLPLEHLQLLRRILHPALDQVDLVAHQPETLLHLLLHAQNLLRDQRGQGRVRARGWLRRLC